VNGYEAQAQAGFQARYALLNTLRHTAERDVLAEMLPVPRTRMKWSAADADQPARSWRAPAS
jgi:hypothetical protein